MEKVKKSEFKDVFNSVRSLKPLKTIRITLKDEISYLMKHLPEIWFQVFVALQSRRGVRGGLGVRTGVDLFYLVDPPPLCPGCQRSIRSTNHTLQSTIAAIIPKIPREDGDVSPQDPRAAQTPTRPREETTSNYSSVCLKTTTLARTPSPHKTSPRFCRRMKL